MPPFPEAGSQAGRIPGSGFGRRRGYAAIGRKNMVSGVSQSWADALERSWPGEISRDVAMAQWCTLRVGGVARVLASPAHLEELEQLLGVLQKLAVPWLVIGGGSNILFSDRGFQGVIVALGKRFASISAAQADPAGQMKVIVEGGCSLMRLINWCTDKGLSGLEFAAGIPGSVGGAISMNAGAWGGEMSEAVDAVTFVTPAGEVKRKTRSELAFAYRHLERGKDIVAVGEFLMTPAGREGVELKVKDVVARRKKSQPQNVASAGSFFKNPPGDAAGRLIEAAGLKGCSVGGAMVSPLHANFIINTGSATASDVLDLMKTVQERVTRLFGVTLEPEVSIIGDW